MTGETLSAAFLTPVELTGSSWLLLLLPLSLGVSIVYRATRVDDLTRVWRSVLGLWLQIIGWLVGLGIAVYVFLRLTLDR